MDMEKFKYSKCPHCKKYGIGAFRGISHTTNYDQTCKYCGKIYVFNWALSFILKIIITAFFGGIGFIINTYIKNVPIILLTVVLTILAVFSFYLIVRICPMEEVKEKK